MKRYELSATTKFKKDLKKIIKRGYDIEVLNSIVETLQSAEPLNVKYKDHALNGNWQGYRECHVLPDWLLVYRIENSVLVLTLARTGTHSDLFI